jgi:hypothetical protein
LVAPARPRHGFALPTLYGLTKHIGLDKNGSVKSNGSTCIMPGGTARRVLLDHIGDLAELIRAMKPHEAIALGSLRSDLSDEVRIVAKRKLSGAQPLSIARTSSNIIYQKGRPALALLDYDTKGMPSNVRARLAELGGFWAALVSVLPELSTVAHVTRRSTSAGLSRTDTGEDLPGSDGLHVYAMVTDGLDAERFLRALHGRCWLAGLGWMMVGAGGQLLERSIVDRSAPERLVFEGAPVLDPPLAQDLESRRPVVTGGQTLDTIRACPPLTMLEQAKFQDLRAKEAHQLAPERAQAREAFIAQHAKRLAKRTGMAAERAARATARQCEGVLWPDVVLPFDDPELAGKTVADVLANPAKFDGATMADPLEGIDYGVGKAKIMRRSDGAPWIHSFAHGRTVYHLKLDAVAVRATMEEAAPDAVVGILVRLALNADLDEVELEELQRHAAQRAGVGIRAIQRTLKAATERQQQQRQEERNRRAAERSDPRPQLPAPAADAEWLPQMKVLNDVLLQSPAIEPPWRDIDDACAQKRMRRVPNMHAFTSANDKD